MKLVLIAALAIAPIAFAETDPFLAPDSGATPSVGDTPAPSLGAPESKDPVLAAPTQPEAQAPLPVSSIPGKTETSAPPPSSPVAKPSDKSIYDEYDDYLDREKDRQATEKDLSQRNLFPHENGAWQLGLIYARGAFSSYNFNFKFAETGTSKLFAETSGANLDVTWFPLKSLTFGRLGFGVVGGMYWSTFETSTPVFTNTTGATQGSTVTKATPQEILSYGVRAVYEFDYWLGQIIVPFATIGAENLVIKGYSVRVAQQTGAVAFMDFPTRHLVSQFYGGGAHFNLNRVEPIAASKALAALGVRKFYLSYMAIQRSGEFQGLTHNLGLNFEF